MNPADYNIGVWFLSVVYLVRCLARAELPEQCCPLGLLGLEKASGQVTIAGGFRSGSLPCGSGWAFVLSVENAGLDNQATSVAPVDGTVLNTLL